MRDYFLAVARFFRVPARRVLGLFSEEEVARLLAEVKANLDDDARRNR